MHTHDLRLSEVLDEYLYDEPGLGHSAIRKTRVAFRHMIAAIGDKPAGDVTRDDCRDFRRYMIRDAWNRRTGANGFTPRSTNGYIKCVRPIIAWARSACEVVNPFYGVKGIKEPALDIRAFSQEEIGKLLQQASDEMRLFIVVALSTAMRKAELLNLRFCDIDFERKLAYVKSRPDSRVEGTWRWGPKKAYPTPLPLTDAAVDMIAERRMETPGQPYMMLARRRYLGLRDRIGRLSDDNREHPDRNINQKFDRLMERAQVPKDGRSIHNLRKTACSAWMWSGKMSLKDVQTLMRHAGPELLINTYTAVNPQVMEKARQASYV